jgi:hypothetical protein
MFERERVGSPHQAAERTRYGASLLRQALRHLDLSQRQPDAGVLELQALTPAHGPVDR